MLLGSRWQILTHGQESKNICSSSNDYKIREKAGLKFQTDCKKDQTNKQNKTKQTDKTKQNLQSFVSWNFIEPEMHPKGFGSPRGPWLECN